MSEAMTGQIVGLTHERGDSNYECGLEDCECPDHEGSPMRPGVYVTFRLDKENAPLGFWRGTLTAEQGGQNDEKR